MTHAPLKAYRHAGYTINKIGNMWQAIDPATSTIMYSHHDESAVKKWASEHPKK